MIEKKKCFKNINNMGNRNDFRMHEKRNEFINKQTNVAVSSIINSLNLLNERGSKSELRYLLKNNFCIFLSLAFTTLTLE